MSPSPHVSVVVDLARVRASAGRIAAATGVPVIAVVKADAYGHGAAAVADAIGELVSDFYVHDSAEALAADLFGRTGKPSIALLSAWTDPADFRAANIRPVVWEIAQAAALRNADPVLSIDLGQQRFACPPERIADAITAGAIREAMTHASRLDQAERFGALTDPFASEPQQSGDRPFRRHAAGSALLAHPAARFDAVRPGLALYAGAASVTTPLVQATDAAGPAGYTQFQVARFGVIRCGYSNGVRAGPCLVNGRESRILEVGMQTAFVEIAPTDRRGDAVTLLGDSLAAETVAAAWHTSPQEVLVRLCGAGVRTHRRG